MCFKILLAFLRMAVSITIFIYSHSSLAQQKAGGLNCDSTTDAQTNGHGKDEYRTVNVDLEYEPGLTATFKRGYVLKYGLSKCGKSTDPYQKLVVMFHGGGGSACQFRDGVKVNSAAGVGGANSHPYVTTDCINNKKTLYVYPNGLRGMDHPDYAKDGSLLFDSGEFTATGVNPSSRQFNDGRDPKVPLKESQFIEKIYNQLNGKTVNGSPVKFDGSIYLAGHSNGGTVQWKVMAENKKVKALFLIAGLMFEQVANDYPLPKQAHVFMVQGLQDGMQNFDGTPGKMLGAYETIANVALQYGYNPILDVNTWTYPNQAPTIKDSYSNEMRDYYFGSYPPKVGSKMILLTQVGLTQNAHGASVGAGHCWHGNKGVTSLVINGEKVTEECTGQYASTFWMIYSFNEADKWDAR